MRRVHRGLIGIVVVLGMVVQASELWAQKKGAYRVVVLANQVGAVESLNAAGLAVGNLEDAAGLPQPYAWLVGPGDSVVTFALGDTYAYGRAYDVNAAGMIVGDVNPTGLNEDSRAALWHSAVDPAIELPLPEGGEYIYSTAQAISETPDASQDLKAVITGACQERLGDGTVIGKALAWAIRTDNTLVGPVTIAQDIVVRFTPFPEDINRNLTVVGSLGGHAVQWQLAWNGNSLSVLSQQMLFAAGVYRESSAKAINDDGDICGYRYPVATSSADYAFLLDRTVTRDAQGNVLSVKVVDQPLKRLVETRRETTRNFQARAIDNSSPPRVLGSAYVKSLSSGFITRNEFPVIWSGSSVTDVQKLCSSSILPWYYMPAITDTGWLGGQAVTDNNDIPRVPCVVIPQ